MLNLVVDLIHQGIPILELVVALLKVGRHGDVVKEHGIQIEAVVGTVKAELTARGGAAALIDGKAEGLLGLALTFLDVGLLPPQGGAGHGWLSMR